jgi:hypothetical protein
LAKRTSETVCCLESMAWMLFSSSRNTHHQPSEEKKERLIFNGARSSCRKLSVWTLANFVRKTTWALHVLISYLVSMMKLLHLPVMLRVPVNTALEETSQENYQNFHTYSLDIFRIFWSKQTLCMFLNLVVLWCSFWIQHW